MAAKDVHLFATFGFRCHMYLFVELLFAVFGATQNIPSVLDADLHASVVATGWEEEIVGLLLALDEAAWTTTSVGQNVVLTFATKETEYLAYNLITSARKTGLQEMTVVFFGKMLPNFCHMHARLHCVLVERNVSTFQEITNRRHMGDLLYKAMMVAKQVSVWFLLQKGYHVLSLDTDVFLEKNVLLHLSSLSGFDFAAQGINCVGKSWNCYGINGGLLYVRASNASIKLIHRSIVEYKGEISHQEALNIAASQIAAEEKLRIWRLEYDQYPYFEDVIRYCRGFIDHRAIVAVHLTGHRCTIGKYMTSIRVKFSMLRRHGFLQKEALNYYSLREFGFSFPLPQSSNTYAYSTQSTVLGRSLGSCSLLFASFFITSSADRHDEAITRLIMALKSAKKHHPSACLAVISKKSSSLNHLIESDIFILGVLPADQEEMGREFFKSLSMPRYQALTLLLEYLPPELSVVLMDGDMIVKGKVDYLFTQDFHVGLTVMRIPSIRWVARHYQNERRDRRTGEVFSGGMFFIPSYGREQAKVFFHELVLVARELSTGAAQHLPDQAVIYHLFQQQGKIGELEASIEKNQTYSCSQLLLQGMVVHFALFGWEFNAPFGLHCPHDRVVHFKGLNSNWPQSDENPKTTMLRVHNDSQILSCGHCQQSGFSLLDGKQERRIFAKFEGNTQVTCVSTGAVANLASGRGARAWLRGGME